MSASHLQSSKNPKRLSLYSCHFWALHGALLVDWKMFVFASLTLSLFIPLNLPFVLLTLNDNDADTTPGFWRRCSWEPHCKFQINKLQCATTQLIIEQGMKDSCCKNHPWHSNTSPSNNTNSSTIPKVIAISAGYHNEWWNNMNESKIARGGGDVCHSRFNWK